MKWSVGMLRFVIRITACEHTSQTLNIILLKSTLLNSFFVKLNRGAVFLAENAVIRKDLLKLWIRALILLQEKEAGVLSTVCDSAATHVAVWNAWKMYGRPEGKKNMNNKIAHPTQTETPVYFIRDAPHLMKTISNHLFTNKMFRYPFWYSIVIKLKLVSNHLCMFIKVGGQKVSFSYIEELFKKENSVEFLISNCGLKSEFTLVFTGLYRNNFQIMRVSLAVQLASLIDTVLLPQ